MADAGNRLKLLEEEIERRLVERFAALRDEFDRLRLESDRRWAGFLGRFEQKFSGIVPTEFMPSEPPPKPAVGVLPAEAARLLDAAANQVEALQRFLDLCSHYASRVALLVSRGQTISVWKAVGFSDHGGNDEAARRVTLPSGPGTVLVTVMDGHPCQLPGDNDVSRALSADGASKAVLVPMVVKEKISGALYADCVAFEESRFDPEALALLTFLAGLIVDRVASRKWNPAPPLSAIKTLEPATPTAQEPEPAPEPEPEFELAEAEEVSHPEELGAHAAQEIETPPAPERAPAGPPPPPQLYGFPPEEEPQRPTSAPFPRPSLDSVEAAMRPEPPLELAVEPTEAPALDRSVRFPASVPDEVAAPPAAPRPQPPQMEPAPPAPRVSEGARRLAGPLAPVEGNERRDEARRFAKLLVSEIKLYNEKAVVQGRERGNIYELLKEDIDRSRQMYDERIPEDVRASSNFFYEELVRILADGRTEALGI